MKELKNKNIKRRSINMDNFDLKKYLAEGFKESYTKTKNKDILFILLTLNTITEKPVICTS